LLSTQEGGFGVKDLHRQNRCLLLNFIHKLHQPERLPWIAWYRRDGRDLGDVSSSPSFLDKIVLECLPLYRAMTRCVVVSGTSTAFWLDRWLQGGCLADRFPALFSHCTRPHATVAGVSTDGLALQPRLSGAASAELMDVRIILDGLALVDGADRRHIDSPSAPPFSSREAYRWLSPAGPVDTSASIVWATRLPTKVKIFAYLCDIDRLSTRANLFAKSCAPTDSCAACGETETGRHLFFDCSLASSVWARLGVHIPGERFSIWSLLPPPGVGSTSWRFGCATILWAIWKARNDLVFNSRPCSTTTVLRRVCEDLGTWRWRLKGTERQRLDDLRSLLLLKCNV
jgi:hypothetical protein